MRPRLRELNEPPDPATLSAFGFSIIGANLGIALK
jgi:hypothetical protein